MTPAPPDGTTTAARSAAVLCSSVTNPMGVAWFSAHQGRCKSSTAGRTELPQATNAPAPLPGCGGSPTGCGGSSSGGLEWQFTTQDPRRRPQARPRALGLWCYRSDTAPARHYSHAHSTQARAPSTERLGGASSNAASNRTRVDKRSVVVGCPPRGLSHVVRARRTPHSEIIAHSRLRGILVVGRRGRDEHLVRQHAPDRRRRERRRRGLVSVARIVVSVVAEPRLLRRRLRLHGRRGQRWEPVPVTRRRREAAERGGAR